MVEAYKKHIVVAKGFRDELSRQYAPMASVSWESDGKQNLHVLESSSQRFETSTDAAKFALRQAQRWIDQHRI